MEERHDPSTRLLYSGKSDKPEVLLTKQQSHIVGFTRECFQYVAAIVAFDCGTSCQ